MSWKSTDPVRERMQFVAAAQRGEESIAALCRQFGVSRKTGHKWLRRAAEEGPEGLRDRGRAPRSHPNQIDARIEHAILVIRRAHPTWGSKKILAALERDRPGETWPARSTVDAVLARAGVVRPRRLRRRRVERAKPFVEPSHPNEVWTIDYKGWFRVGDGTRCDPLTINDAFSRCSLVCKGMVRPQLEDVRKQLEAGFRSFGLPNAILSDNGPPFASQGLGGLSRLSVWLLRLGVEPLFIQPGHPEQNGRHERFHATLKRETASPPRATIPAQQRAFNEFQIVYNEVRPHEALGMDVPASRYDFSTREMPATIPDHAYAAGVETRRVRHDGGVKWKSKPTFLGQAFRGELIGITPVDEGVCDVWLGRYRLRALHERSGTIVPFAAPSEGVTHVPGHEVEGHGPA